MKLNFDEPLSDVAFNFSLRRYIEAALSAAQAQAADMVEAMNAAAAHNKQLRAEVSAGVRRCRLNQ